MIRCSRPLTTYPVRANRSNTLFWAICVAGDDDAWSDIGGRFLPDSRIAGPLLREMLAGEGLLHRGAAHYGAVDDGLHGDTCVAGLRDVLEPPPP
jgi:hypothetical protein